jgi:hypothetical protein
MKPDGQIGRLIGWPAWLRDVYYARLYLRFKSATMVPRRTFIANLRVAYQALQQCPGGAVIECGTWRGGMSAALIELGGRDRDYHFFDSFAGLPPAQEIDGKDAIAWQSNVTSPYYFDNCAVSRGEFEAAIRGCDVDPDRVHIHQGWFKDTLTAFDPPPIAVLRLDGDWYASTIVCLEHLWDRVQPNGAVLIDDYYVFDGCRRAVHDFLSRRQLAEPIQQGERYLAFIVKHGD